MQIDGSVALVTGADRGLGQVYARELVSRGAAKVYGAARHAAAVTEPGVTPIALDITDPERVAQVAQQCADVSLLVNNAGVMAASTFTSAPGLDPARLEMETNYVEGHPVASAAAPCWHAYRSPRTVRSASSIPHCCCGLTRPTISPRRPASTAPTCSTRTRVVSPSSSISGRNDAGLALRDVGATSTTDRGSNSLACTTTP